MSAQLVIDPDDAQGWADLVDDPTVFIPVVLRTELWRKQEEIALAIRDYDRVAVEACNASGKSFLIGRIIAWWNCRYPSDGKVLITAAGWQQVKNIASVEYRAALQSSRIKLPDLNAQAEARDEEGRPIVIGIAPKNAVRMQGHHAGHILIIVDEASSPDIPWEAIEGNLAGGKAHLLMLGNPTILGGYYYDAFHGKAANQYKRITIDAFETPNLEGFTVDDLRALPKDLDQSNPIFRHEPVLGLVTRWWVYQKYHAWGENSPHWQSRVRGVFPDQAEDSVFPMAWLRDAQKRLLVPNSERMRAGVDVAGPGDDETVMYLTQGGNILGFRAWHGDSRQPCLAELRKNKDMLETVAIDRSGIGTYFWPTIAEDGFPVQPVNFGDKALHDTEFNLYKAELFWHVRGLFRDGLIAGLNDEETIQQLASIRYKEDDRGRIAIERKEEAKKRGVKSPDRAEALILALGNTEPSILKFYRDEARRVAKSEGLLSPDIEAPAERPPVTPHSENTYTRTMQKLTIGAKLCKHCQQPITGSRIEMGEIIYHIKCARELGVA